MAIRRASLVLAAVLLAAGCAPPAGSPRASVPEAGFEPAGPTVTARVVRVVDGDTVIVDRGRGQERLRYIGVDAPESVRPNAPVEPFGEEASHANRALVDGREVVLERDVSDRDRFDRLLRYVWLAEGDRWVLVNLALVRDGYAQAVSFPPDVRWQEALREAERGAREAGTGLWGAASPPP